MKRLGYLVVIGFIFALMIFTVSMTAASPITQMTQTPVITYLGHVASPEELAQAVMEWSNSAHADTYDDGLGADTTCARCKSPLNWDPTQELAASEALDCYSCKRVPGAERPSLETGVAVPRSMWQDISCEICHIPVGDSFYTGIAFWDQALKNYVPISNVTELCARCHEGQHGFEVVEEMAKSRIHITMECTDCHGAHGGSVSCTDCHILDSSFSAQEHRQHPTVNCTACHDQSGLSIWLDEEMGSDHYGEYITRRFAHTLTSWPSHDLAKEVDCLRCHHLLDTHTPAIVPSISCEACHVHKSGAVQFWCTDFPRDPDPNANLQR
jgi:hypothetical protein